MLLGRGDVASVLPASRLAPVSALEGQQDEESDAASQAREILERIHHQHMDTLRELVRVRMIDRTVADGLLAESARIHNMVSEDAMRSLKTFQYEARQSINGLRTSLENLLQPVPDKRLKGNIEALLVKHQREVTASSVLPLCLFDAARADMRSFLQRRLDNVAAQREARMVAEACLERFNNHMNASWGFLDLPAMNNPEVVLRVQMGLSLTRPLVANYFHGALEGVLSLLGLKPPKAGEPQQLSRETSSRHHARLLKQCLSQVSEGYQTDWEGRDGHEDAGDLHLNYLEDFSVRNPDAVHSVFDSTLIEDLLGPLSDLNLEQTYASKEPRPFKDKEELWDTFGQISPPEQRYVADILASSVARASGYLIGEGEEFEDPPPPQNAGVDVVPQHPGTGTGKAEEQNPKSVPQAGPPPVPKALPQVPDKSVQPTASKQNKTDPPQGPSSGLSKRKPEDQPPGAPLPKKAKTSSSAGTSFVTLQGLTIPAEGSKSITATFALQSQGGIDPDLRQKLGINPPKVVGRLRPVKDLPPEPEHPEEVEIEDPPDDKIAPSQSKPSGEGTNPASQQEKPKPPPEKGQEIPPSHEDKSQKTTEAEKEVRPGTSGMKVPQGASGGGGAHIDEEDDDEEDDDEEDENGNGDGDAGLTQEERELKEAEKVMDRARYKAFTDDTELAQQARNMLLGLDPGARLSRREIKGDNRFDYIRAAAVPKGSPVEDVSAHWEKLFSDKQLFATCLPSEVEVADDWETIYRTEDLIALVPTTAGAWKSQDKKPRFVIVAHPSRTVDHLKQKDFGITNFHEPASVKKVSINFGGKGNRKQIAFCPYCGIHYENNETALSHLRQHLSLEFLCGGCLTSRHLAPGTLGRHMAHCGAIPAAAKPKTRSSVRN